MGIFFFADVSSLPSHVYVNVIKQWLAETRDLFRTILSLGEHRDWLTSVFRSTSPSLDQLSRRHMQLPDHAANCLHRSQSAGGRIPPWSYRFFGKPLQ
jgi:hypothetical protein